MITYLMSAAAQAATAALPVAPPVPSPAWRRLPVAAPPAPPPPPPVRFGDERPAMLQNPSDIVRAKDYPKQALRAGAQGAVRFSVVVSAKGRPTGCRVIESSGNALLDAKTCAQVMKRARFTPARNLRNEPVVSSYTRRIVWRLPE